MFYIALVRRTWMCALQLDPVLLQEVHPSEVHGRGVDERRVSVLRPVCGEIHGSQREDWAADATGPAGRSPPIDLDERHCTAVNTVKGTQCQAHPHFNRIVTDSKRLARVDGNGEC